MAKQLYALHTYYTQPNGRKRYYRLSFLAYSKATAVRVFQNALLDATFMGVPIALKTVQVQQDDTCPRMYETLGQMAEAIYTSGARNV